jgi:predicted oxidoreductase
LKAASGIDTPARSASAAAEAAADVSSASDTTDEPEDGTPLPNLFAGGGAARGISGPSSWGYMAGNGLLTATTFGRLAGEAAARMMR